MKQQPTGVVELAIIPLDQYYYVSRESGDTFRTKPYIMHTALFYALGLLPTRFRVTDQTPAYSQHFKQVAGTNGLYIHPARIVGKQEHTTRRFSVKGDAFRNEAVQENKNLLETGHQRTLDPDQTFRTFVLCRGEKSPDELVDGIPPYVRVGKKMAIARVQTHVHEVERRVGQFELGQPVGQSDIPSEEYDVLGNVKMESMAPVSLITAIDLSGSYVTIEPAFGQNGRDSVELPADAQFLGFQQ